MFNLSFSFYICDAIVISLVSGERKSINSELWHACAGPLVSLPPVGSLVVYFPQGHSEQVAASMQKQTDFIPSYPNLPSKLICMLHNVTLDADPETDEVYAQMTLQPVSKYDKEAILTSEMGFKQSRQPAEFFCKTLTASDTSTHGGFSVPRRAAEKIFPPLDHSMQPPSQELSARDLHDNNWTFRHIYRGQPKRHLLTTGWSIFVSTKRLLAGDSVLFIRDEKSQFQVGVKHANRQQPALSSSVISSDSMHIGVLAAAAHAAANSSPFTVFYNPRASPCEFVIPFAKYNKAMFSQVSLGMRFRMMFETEESGVRRYMGTITGISDMDPVRWKNSQWRNLQVGWDESTAGERPRRVSIWEIEPVVTPFYICAPPFFRPKLPRQPDDDSDMENIFKRTMPWLGDEFGMKDAPNSILPGLSLVQWMSMQQNSQFPGAQLGFNPSMLPSNALHNNLAGDDPSKLLSFQAPGFSAANLQFGKANPQNQLNQLSPTSLPWTQQQQLQQLLQADMNQQQQSRQQQPHGQEQKQLQQPQSWQQQNLNHQQPHAQHPQFQQVQQQPSHLQKQQQQQILQSPPTSSSLVGLNPIQGQNLQHPHQKNPVVNNSQPHGATSATKSSYTLTSLPQDSQFQQQTEQQPSILQRHQQQAQVQQSPPQLLQQNLSQKSNLQPQQQAQMQNLSHPMLSEQQLQLQMLQKLQQQQPLLSPSSSQLQPQLMQQQQTYQQNHQLQQLPQLHSQMLPTNNNSFSTSSLMQSQTFPVNQPQGLHKLQTAVKGHSSLTDGETLSCSTSPSTNNCQVSSNLLSKNQQPPSLLMGDSSVEPASNLLQDLPSKSDTRDRNEFHSSRVSEQLKYKGSITDPLEASSSVTTYCHDAGNMQQNFHLSTLGLDGDVQSHPQSSIPFGANIDGLAPDTLLSRGYDSQKDLQNLLANYGSNPRDLDTELSSAAMSSQAFGVPDMSFKGGCSHDVPMNDTGVLNGGIWGSQTQRMRTYTKVQKRGSVGRSIDVTRYKGYDELRHDLARMFGIEGQLEDPQSSDWKLVYVDHENDILLVGDDPWEEFLACVQSIKILSSAEVQQMSLDGDLGIVPIPNQACSGTDS